MTSVGVTGHRALSDTGSIIRGIDIALHKIREVFPGPYTLYSSLAEGADRLVTGRALEILQARLAVLLPMPLADYLSDFSPPSQEELAALLRQADERIELPSQARRENSYAAAGHYLVEHSDVLIAVWDGQAARGQGGTGQIIAEARQRRMPVAWVLAGNQDLVSKDGPGSVTLERFPA